MGAKVDEIMYKFSPTPPPKSSPKDLAISQRSALFTAPPQSLKFCPARTDIQPADLDMSENSVSPYFRVSVVKLGVWV